MFDPIKTSKSPLSSRIALPTALLLAGTFGLAIATVQSSKVFKKNQHPSLITAASPHSAVPEAQEFAHLVNAPTAEDSLVQFCSRHVTANRSFVVFNRGTCVVINEPCSNPINKAREILAKCDDANAKFVSEPTAEGDLIVTFKEPVFHRFAPSEIATMEPELVRTASSLLSPAESVAAGNSWTPPAAARLGLVARRRMLEDVAEAAPMRIVRAKERSIVAR
jgi:hypothetical protein